MNNQKSEYERLNELAYAGYNYASGKSGIPELFSEFEIDCFNAGISNYNITNNTNIRNIIEGMKYTFIEGSNNKTSDKELAIVGA